MKVPRYDTLMDLIDGYHADIQRLVNGMVKVDGRNQRRYLRNQVVHTLANAENHMRKLCANCKGEATWRTTRD